MFSGILEHALRTEGTPVAGPTQPHSEWLAAVNPNVLLNIVNPQVQRPGQPEPPPPQTARRPQLFGVACARMVWELLSAYARNEVLIRERFAEERATEADLRVSALGWFWASRVTNTAFQHATRCACYAVGYIEWEPGIVV